MITQIRMLLGLPFISLAKIFLCIGMLIRYGFDTTDLAMNFIHHPEDNGIDEK